MKETFELMSQFTKIEINYYNQFTDPLINLVLYPLRIFS